MPSLTRRTCNTKSLPTTLHLEVLVLESVAFVIYPINEKFVYSKSFEFGITNSSKKISSSILLVVITLGYFPYSQMVVVQPASQT